MSSIGKALLNLPSTAYINQIVEGEIYIELTDYPTLDEINNCTINMNIYVDGNLTVPTLLLSDLKANVKVYRGKIYLKFNQPGTHKVRIYVYYGYKDNPKMECKFGGGRGGGHILPT